MNVCPTCGKPFTSGEKFCQKCGTPLPAFDAQSADPGATAPYANLCPVCGRMFTPGDRHCQQCGSELPEMSPVPVSVPSMRSAAYSNREYSSGGIMRFLKNGLRTMTGLLFVLSMIAMTILGGAAGAMVYDGGSGGGLIILGALAGFVVGLIINVVLYGMIATIIHISDTNEMILKYLRDNVGK